MADFGGEGLLVDIDTGVVRRDHVLVQSTAGALLFLGCGPRAEKLRRFAFDEAEDPDPFILRCRRIARAIEEGRLAKAERSGVPRAVLQLKDAALRRLLIAESLAKAGYNPDEPRDERGRWADEGGGTAGGSGANNGPTGAAHARTTTGAASASAVAAAESGTGGSATSFFGDVGPDVLAGLARLGTRFSAPTTFLGLIFIPTNSSLVQDGKLPGRPDISFRHDLDTGNLHAVAERSSVRLGPGRSGRSTARRQRPPLRPIPRRQYSPRSRCAAGLRVVWPRHASTPHRRPSR